MTITFKSLTKIVEGQVIHEADANWPIEHLLTDSRKVAPAVGAIFFAIKGVRHDGHDYVPHLIKEGIKQFVVEHDLDLVNGSGINVLKVEDSLNALQQLARFKRSQYDIPVIGITGSNGKTIVKEWLSQLLNPFKAVLKSPGSYNSQVGVPLSVYRLGSNHEMAIFEAGISTVGEMSKLANIIQPTVGIFTTIGSAHDEGFASQQQKIGEKAVLFQRASRVIYCKDYKSIDRVIHNKGFTWGHHPESDILINDISYSDGFTTITLTYNKSSLKFTLPFTHHASIENAMHCIAFMLMHMFSRKEIQTGLDGLKTVKMRLELKRGINGCQLIDDSYNSDLGGLQVALDFLSGQKQLTKKTLIISDLLQTGLKKEELYNSISSQIKSISPEKVIVIGPDVSKNLAPDLITAAYPTTEAFIEQHDLTSFDQELVLIKGARPFKLEQIVKLLEEKIHGTHLEINLDALTHNLNFYRSRINPKSKLMVMVKAFAYGSGSLEVANLLQYHRVDYLGVAYADEGVTLRRNGIHLPIMVMNPTEESFQKIKAYDLEPEIYNPGILRKFVSFLNGRSGLVHIKLDTGMHRLGFKRNEAGTLIELLKKNNNITVKSIFSHLAGADEEHHNLYSKQQAEAFLEYSQQIIDTLDINPLRHLVNSPGIIRFPEYHMDMVRLGIGLYGVEASNQLQDKLVPISSLKTIVSQINYLKAGETVGYSRKGKVDRDTTVATIAIGYADGFSRAFGNGKGWVFVKGHKAPVLGNVCMDMTMIDVTDVPNVQEGDEVEIFGKNITISEVARFIDTIPYEILTSVSQRVKRVYYAE